MKKKIFTNHFICNYLAIIISALAAAKCCRVWMLKYALEPDYPHR